jgi:glycosyltransferase involved in cell wall biosynthesis
MTPGPSRRSRRGLRVAMIGQRGVPATFGGIEHHVEELGSRLAARGHDVTVFCRTNYVAARPSRYRGMRLHHLPTVGRKHLDAIVHSALASMCTLGGGFDIVHYHALGPGVLAPLPRYLSSARVVQTVHGLDNHRAKWSRPAQAFLTSAVWLSARVPDATITVSRALADHYARQYGRDVVHIPNGIEAPLERPGAREITERWGLAPASYVLFVGRLVPEKAPDVLIRAFRRVQCELRVVLAGGSSFTDAFTRHLHELAARDRRVLLAGYVYGRALAELYANAAAFVLPSSLEGMPLTLLEAASYGTPLVASDIPPHVEVLGEERPGRRLFPCGDEVALARALERSLSDPGAERAAAMAFAGEVTRRYPWDAAVDATEALYRRLVAARAASVSPAPSAASVPSAEPSVRQA